MPVPPAGADASARAAAGVFRSLREPPLDDRFERRGVDVVELVPALAAGLDQARGLQNVEVLRDRLPRRAKPVLDRQARADLKQRLPVPVGQLVEDRAARRIGQGLEDVTHTPQRYASRYLPVNIGSGRTGRGWPARAGPARSPLGYPAPATPITLPSGSAKWPITRPVGARAGPRRRVPPRLSALRSAVSTSGTPT